MDEGSLMYRGQKVVVALFILTAVGSLIFFLINRPRIVIIQSQSAESFRERDFRDGLLAELKKNHLIAKLTWYSLEQDNVPNSQAKTAGALRAIERESPDLIILFDDVANERIGRSLALQDKTKVLYVGIGHPPDYYGYSGKKHIAGIGEHLRLEPIHELLSILYPSKSMKYGVIGVDNPRGHARLEQIRGCPWNNHLLAAAALVSDFSSWKDFIQQHQDLDVLLILNYEALPEAAGKTTLIEGNELVSWTEENTKGLPIGVESSYVRNGGGLAFELSPKYFGEKAMDRAREWLGPEHAYPPVYEFSSQFDVALCLARLESRNVTLPAIYLESARIGGRLLP
jgi:hypothetical protein